MKRFIIISILIVILSGCNTNYTSENAVSASLDEVSNNVAVDLDLDKKSILIGTWHNAPYVAAAYGPRYHFFDDGVFIFENSDYDGMDIILSESGGWTVDEDKITLEIRETTIVDGGERINFGTNDVPEYAIVNGTIKILTVMPPEIKEYPAIFSVDNENSTGYYTISIDGTQYWRIHLSPDEYLGIQYKDGDIYNEYEK